MTVGVAVVNVILGAVYTSYGFITLFELKRGWKEYGYSPFGGAWVLMAFTCGPHHLDHGVHMLVDGTPGGALDFTAVLIGFPAGVTWFLLRIEALRGGAGDRLIPGTPRWVAAIPFVAIGYAVWIFAAMIPRAADGMFWEAPILANVGLVGLYAVIGLVLLRTQFANRRHMPGWSLSGIALGIVFPTCAIMHAVHASYVMGGLYSYNRHLALIDWLAVPAAAYFLWVVWGLHRQAVEDWNQTPERPVMLAG